MHEIVTSIISNEMQEQLRSNFIKFLIDNGIITNKTLMIMFRRMLYKKICDYNIKKYHSWKCMSSLSIIGIFGIYMITKRKKQQNIINDNKTDIIGIYDNRKIDQNGDMSIINNTTKQLNSFSIRNTTGR